MSISPSNYTPCNSTWMCLIETINFRCDVNKDDVRIFFLIALLRNILQKNDATNLHSQSFFYCFFTPELLIRSMKKISQSLGGQQNVAHKEIEIIHRLFLVIAMYCQSRSSQFNESLNLPRCQVAGKEAQVHAVGSNSLETTYILFKLPQLLTGQTSLACPGISDMITFC